LRQNRRAKVYYATQAQTNPPTVVLFTNGPELFDNTYQRYLVKYLRDRLPFHDVPIRLQLRQRSREEGPARERDRERPEPAQTTPREETPRRPRRKDQVQEPELWK